MSRACDGISLPSVEFGRGSRLHVWSLRHEKVDEKVEEEERRRRTGGGAAGNVGSAGNVGAGNRRERRE